MATSYPCICTYHGCYHKIDPLSGERGFSLDARTYRQHQKDERLSLLAQRARSSQEAALRHQEEAISNRHTLLSSSSSPGPDTFSGSTKYKADFKRKLVSDISAAQDTIKRLCADLRTIGFAPSQLPSSEVINSALKSCKNIRMMAGEASRILTTAMTGQYRKEPCVKALVEEVKEDLQQFNVELDGMESSWNKVLRMREALKEDDIHCNGGGIMIDSSKHYRSPLLNAPVLVQLATLMIVACHIILRLPRRGCSWLFSMCSYIIEVTVEQSKVSGALLTVFQKLIKSFPRDVRASTKSFQLDGECTVYAVCPKCRETYRPGGERDMPIYPQRCTSNRYSNRCREILVRPKKIGDHQIFLPILSYVVYDMPDWMAGLMAREGYEEMMDKAWNRMSTTQDGHVEDIFQGSIVRNFNGPDGKTHFSKSGPNQHTGRYIFSMGCDFFNPLRIIANGKNVSFGVIALACLNIPISERYKPENLFLAAIIPGPSEPTYDEINSFLRPIVEIFLLFWKGIYLSRTSMYEGGRWVLCALVVIICDLPAARKVVGYGSHNHQYFCTLCWCTRNEHTHKNYDTDSWIRRHNESWRAWAQLIKSAKSLEEAKSILDRTGLRRSVFLDLPYFKPTEHLVVDPMHNLFLGLIKEHFQHILGYVPRTRTDKRKKNAKPNVTGSRKGLDLQIFPVDTNPAPTSPSEQKSVRALVQHLRQPLSFDRYNTPEFEKKVQAWSKYHLAALVYVGRSVGCLPDTMTLEGRDTSFPFAKAIRKASLAQILLIWRFEQESTFRAPEPQLSSAVEGQAFGNIFTQEEMESLWDDIENMVKPSWMASVPKNISTISHKLKSDEWRSMSTLYLPVTLVRLWSHETNNSGRRRDLLHLTILLCSAITIITSRTISEDQGNEYLKFMKMYRQELERLFPAYPCKVNHHMAMHVGEFLEMYGPVYGWWTFPFERMIGSLQRMSTNYRPGQYELTIGRAWYRYSNFRAFFKKRTCPPAIVFCASMFEKLVRTQIRNALADPEDWTMSLEDQVEDYFNGYDSDDDDDDKGARLGQLPRDVYCALQTAMPPNEVPKTANIIKRVTCDGVVYTTRTIHEGNSGILLHGSDTPFSIVNIVEFPKSRDLERYWLMVRKHTSGEVAVDPYSAYPHIRAKLWGAEMEDGMIAIPLSRVETHFAKCAVRWEGKELIVVVSLSKNYVVKV